MSDYSIVHSYIPDSKVNSYNVDQYVEALEQLELQTDFEAQQAVGEVDNQEAGVDSS